jgi:hypothetical protein
MKKALGEYDEAVKAILKQQDAAAASAAAARGEPGAGEQRMSTNNDDPHPNSDESGAPPQSHKSGDAMELDGGSGVLGVPGDPVGDGPALFEGARIPKEEFAKELNDFLKILKETERNGEDFVKAEKGEGYGSMTLFMAAHCAVRWGKC